MAQKLQTIVTLSGEVDNSFGRIGSELTNLGNQLNGLSQELINFGTDGVNKYVNYDDIMREVQALGDYTSSQRAQMDAYNQMIAQDSRFTMQQAAQAEVLIAQLGLSWQQTQTLMPTVMDMAVAGNLQLADSLNYLYYSLNALGMPLEYAGTLSDHMSKVASISAADIDTLGLSLQRLGSGAQYFTGGSSEILAILGAISDYGEDMQGAEAGTQLRNFMLTLMAPTASKAKLMEQLSISESEWAAFENYMAEAEIDLVATAAAMETLGLSAFDVNGNLKPAIQIIGELDAAMANLGSDAERKNVLGTLFGKRTTITAENLLESYDTILAYQNEILNNSAGYTQAMADTIDGGIGGTLRNTEASIDALKTTVGGILAPEVEFWAGMTTDAVNAINNMDSDALEVLVSGGTALAIAGPGLMTVGSAFRLIGRLVTPAGLTVAAFIALMESASIAMRYFNEVYETDFADKFGEMDLSSTSLPTRIDALGESFRANFSAVDSFSKALDAAVDSYTNASTTLSGELFSFMVSGVELSDADIEYLSGLGTQMHEALLGGLNASLDVSNSYWRMLFGGEEANTDPEYQNIIALTNSSYQSLIAEAQGLSQSFRSALTSAFDDGVISDEEYSELLGWMQAYNDAMAKAAAEAQSEQDYIDYAKMLYKSQTASLDSVRSMAVEADAQRDALLAEKEELYLNEYFGLEYRYNQAIEKGGYINGQLATEEGKQAALLAAERQYALKVGGWNAEYDDMLMRMWETSIQNSDLAGIFGDLNDYADLVLSGALSKEGSAYLFSKFHNKKDVRQLGDYAAYWVDTLGGYEAVEEQMALYRSIGDYDSEQQLARLLIMEGIATGYSWNSVKGDKVARMDGARMYDGSTDHLIPAYTVDSAKSVIDFFWEQSGWGDYIDILGTAIETGDASLISNAKIDNGVLAELSNIVNGLAATYDFERILANESTPLRDSGYQDYVAAYSLMYGNASLNPDQYLINAPTEPVTTTMEIPNGEDAATIANEDAQAYLSSQPVTNNMTIPNGAEAAASANSDAQAYLNANPLSQALNIQVRLGGLQALTNSIGNTGMISGNMSVANQHNAIRMQRYAEGGRATTASIFGEAGAEWAIPEEHTQRVADLLNMAREGAGFTWPELLSRTGGLNAGGLHQPVQLVYSPVIYAQDATDVEEKLLEDKERLNRWLEEKRLMDEVEVYA